MLTDEVDGDAVETYRPGLGEDELTVRLSSSEWLLKGTRFFWDNGKA